MSIISTMSMLFAPKMHRKGDLICLPQMIDTFHSWKR